MLTRHAQQDERQPGAPAAEFRSPIAEAPVSETLPTPLEPDTWLLWTGGWDSTFRLLQLLADTPAVVQPIYVLDAGRLATLHELRAMTNIRKQVCARIPNAGRRMLPTRFFLLDEISKRAEITGLIDILRRRAHVGRQYEWLARLTYDLDKTDVELAIHRGDMALAFVQHHLVTIHDPCTGRSFRLAESAPADLLLFGRFRFPIVEWTKLSMREWAAERGLADVLNSTWFCHRPMGDHPCGTCQPCTYAMAEGMKDRFTLMGRARYLTRPLLGWNATLLGKTAVILRRAGRALLTSRSVA